MQELSLFTCTASRGLCGYSTYFWYIEWPFMYPWGIYKGTSHTQLYIERPFSNSCASDNITMKWSSHVPCVYRETFLGILRPSEHSPLTVLSLQYTENKTLGDYYACFIQVVGCSGKGTVPILLVTFHCWTLCYIASCGSLTILWGSWPFTAPITSFYCCFSLSSVLFFY